MGHHLFVIDALIFFSICLLSELQSLLLLSWERLLALVATTNF